MGQSVQQNMIRHRRTADVALPLFFLCSIQIAKAPH